MQDKQNDDEEKKSAEPSRVPETRPASNDMGARESARETAEISKADAGELSGSGTSAAMAKPVPPAPDELTKAKEVKVSGESSASADAEPQPEVLQGDSAEARLPVSGEAPKELTLPALSESTTSPTKPPPTSADASAPAAEQSSASEGTSPETTTAPAVDNATPPVVSQPSPTPTTSQTRLEPASKGTVAGEVISAAAVLSASEPLNSVTRSEWASSTVHTVLEDAIQVHDDLLARQAMIQSIRRLLEPKAELLSREDLHRAARELKEVIPYNYDAWRLHADILIHALEQLETRNLQPDENFTLLTIPLRENDLRDAAEVALRQCAHYADSEEKRINLIDEANRVRRLTWF